MNDETMTDAPAQLPAVRVIHNDTPIAVFESASSFATAQRMATALSTSTMVPNEYRSVVWTDGKWVENHAAIGNCLIALELHHRLGDSVLTIMQSLDVIHGRPSFRATFLIAKINASPYFTRLRFEWAGTPGKDDWACRAWTLDSRTGDRLDGTWVTWKMATREGWVSRKGSKWQSIPELMFQYRAATFFARIYAPDLLLGLRTSDEEDDLTLPDQRAGADDLNKRLSAPPPDSPEVDDAVPDVEPTPEEKPKRARRNKPPLAQAEPDEKPPAETFGDRAGAEPIAVAEEQANQRATAQVAKIASDSSFDLE